MERRLLHVITLLLSIHILHADVVDGSQSHPDHILAQQRIETLTPHIELPYTSETQRLIDVYTHSYIPGAKRILKRSHTYYSMYDYLLEERALPGVLKNIGIVESNLDPWTFSSRGAVGVWQLMKSTARAHGLRVDRYVDERFDPVKSGIVAFDYLAELYEEFQDWNLTLVAYNFGPTALKKAMKYCKSKEYEIIKDELPKESVKYASRLAAASYLSEYHGEHEILSKLRYEDVQLSSMPVYDFITFEEISVITGLTVEEITKYNPAISYDYLPTNDKGYGINLPLDKMILVASERGWSLTNLNHFDYHRDHIESILAYHYPIQYEQSGPYKEELPEDSEGELASDGLRREQVLSVERVG